SNVHVRRTNSHLRQRCSIPLLGTGSPPVTVRPEAHGICVSVVRLPRSRGELAPLECAWHRSCRRSGEHRWWQATARGGLGRGAGSRSWKLASVYSSFRFVLGY